MQTVNIKIFQRGTQQLLASSGVFNPALVDRKIDVMIEELSRVAGTSASLTLKNVDIVRDDEPQAQAA